MADDRLSCCRSESIAATNSDKFFCRWTAISFRLAQNASSRLTLGLWPAIATERLTTGDFIEATPLRPGPARPTQRRGCPTDRGAEGNRRGTHRGRNPQRAALRLHRRRLRGAAYPSA